jgi:MFS-type transporter involved in bile tolerance (Atg22 family)
MFLAGVTLLVQHVVTLGLLGNMLLLICAGVGLYAAFGPFWAWSLQYIPRDQAGPAMGLINVAGNFGGIVGPVIVGAAAAGGAVSNGFYVLGFFLVGAGLVAVATAAIGRRHAEVH